MLLYWSHVGCVAVAVALNCYLHMRRDGGGGDAVHLWNERSANAIKYKLIYAQSTKHKYFHLHKITKAARPKKLLLRADHKTTGSAYINVKNK